jgi:ABC-type branched-subunit amino acid transport system permease subunit
VILGVVSVEAFEQLTANAIFRGSAYGLLGAGFAIILGVTGRFHFAYGLTYTFAAYMCFTYWDRVGIPFWPASAIGILTATLLGVAIERFIYRPLVFRAGATALLAVFVASLGIGIAGENIIRLFWSSSSQNFFGPEQKRWSIGNVTFLNFDIWQTLTSFALVVLLASLLRFTPLGRQIKATRVNPDLATVIGINANTIYLVCFAIGRSSPRWRLLVRGAVHDHSRHGPTAGDLRIRRRLLGRHRQRTDSCLLRRHRGRPPGAVVVDVHLDSVDADGDLRPSPRLPHCQVTRR